MEDHDHDHDHGHDHEHGHGHVHEPDPEKDLENEELIESAGMLGFIVVPAVKVIEWFKGRKTKPSATPDADR